MATVREDGGTGVTVTGRDVPATESVNASGPSVVRRASRGRRHHEGDLGSSMRVDRNELSSIGGICHCRWRDGHETWQNDRCE